LVLQVASAPRQQKAQYVTAHSTDSFTLTNSLSVGTIAANSVWKIRIMPRRSYGMNEKHLTYRWTEAGYDAAPVGTCLPVMEARPA
jgi:hypothetical protein